jgi:hypothetical protein
VKVGDLVALHPTFLKDDTIPFWRKKDVKGLVAIIVSIDNWLPDDAERVRVIWLGAKMHPLYGDTWLTVNTWWWSRELIIISSVPLLDTSLTQKS